MLGPASNHTVEAVEGGGVGLRVAAVLVLLALTGLAWWALRRSPPARSQEMTVWEHVEEMRRRILVSLAAWLVASALIFSFRYETRGGWPVLVPALEDNLAAQAFRILADHLVPAGVTLVVTRPMDAFMAELILALGIGFAVAMPVILVQAGRFLGPAMERREVRALRMALLPALALFAAGVVFAWLWVVPFILETLYGYSAALGAQPLLVVADLVSFTVALLLTFGVAFQTPLVMHVLSRVGIVRARTFLRGWRYALLAILLFSAFVTDPTIVSQFLVAGPLVVLYFLGIAAARWGESVHRSSDG